MPPPRLVDAAVELVRDRLIVANLPYLPDWLSDEARYDCLRTEPPAPARAAEERLDGEGALVIQFHREVLEATKPELPTLRRRLLAAAAVAA